METPDKEELITGISALLKAHEEEYEMGAWEEFSSRPKRKNPLLWAWIGAAAALAIIFSLLVPEFMQNQRPAAVIVHQKTIIEDEIPEIPKAHITENTEVPSALADQVAKKSAIQVHQKIVTDTSDKKEVEHENYVVSSTVASSDTERYADPVKKVVPRENLTKRFPQTEDQIAVNRDKEESSKWNFGVELLPTVSQSKMTMGAGITTEFKLSKRFSLSSGISYVALDASKSIDHLPVSLMSSKKLVAINANISAIDIPLSITYNVNKRVYTSMGVSYFSVLNEQRNNKYETQMEVATFAKSPETGVTQSLKSQLTEENTEVSSELSLKGNSYIGFFNFSIGHKQEVFNRYNIVVEPFMKVPVGKLSNEDLRLSNGGIKLRFTF